MTWLEGNSEMAARIRAHDWAATSLGPVEGWPVALRHTVELLLAHPLPMALLWGPDHIHLYNDDYAATLGQKHPASLGRPLHDLWPELEHLNRPVFDRVHGGEAVLFEDALYPSARHGAMQDGWYLVAHSPVRDDQGKVAGILVTVFDKTEQREAERRLLATEELQAFLLRLSDALRPLADPVEVKRTAMRLVSDHFGAFQALYFEVGLDGDTVTGIEGVDHGAVPASLPMRISDFGDWTEQAIAEGHPFFICDVDQDTRLDATARAAFHAIGAHACVGVPLRKDGRFVIAIGISLAQPRQWSAGDLHLMEEVAERTWDAVERARAESALRASEDRLRVLVAELQHRVRNILTVVRSVFTRTVEAGGESDSLSDHFRGRLDALARTQVIVTQTAAGTADLENLIRDELMSVGVRDGAHVRIAGPDVILNSRLAESLGLAIHELTTNALKYGALRGNGARLDIGWTVGPDADGRPRLDLQWEEQDVPAIALQPAHDGFGRELIEDALPYRLGAKTRLEFRGGGVRCSISVPLDGMEVATPADQAWSPYRAPSGA